MKSGIPRRQFTWKLVEGENQRNRSIPFLSQIGGRRALNRKELENQEAVLISGLFRFDFLQTKPFP